MSAAPLHEGGAACLTQSLTFLLKTDRRLMNCMDALQHARVNIDPAPFRTLQQSLDDALLALQGRMLVDLDARDADAKEGGAA